MKLNQTQSIENNASSPLWASFAFIAKLWDEVQDLIYPPVCVQCGRVDSLICEPCELLIDYSTAAYVSPMRPHQHIIIGSHVGVLRSAIHALKYENETRIGKLLGSLLAKKIIQQKMTFDTIISVPLHATRLRERGYNQAELIAIQIANESGGQLNTSVLLRQRYTTSQVELSAEERRHNVDGAFNISPSQSAQLQGARILLVDDVCTTGATLWACIEALHAIKDVEIAIATVSYAIH